MFIVFDDVEYAELPFRNARDLVMYYRRQSQIMKESLRKTNKRKKKINHWFRFKRNEQKSVQFTYDRHHSNNIDLSSNHSRRPLVSHLKQHVRFLFSYDHHYRGSSKLI